MISSAYKSLSHSYIIESGGSNNEVCATRMLLSRISIKQY